MLERREYAEEAGHRPTGWSRQIQRFGERDESDAEVIQSKVWTPAVWFIIAAGAGPRMDDDALRR